MTTHYIDIHILPDPEFSLPHLMGALYTKLHRALVKMGAEDIGVSFPEYSLRPIKLGTVLRLHGQESRLNVLLASEWLKGMRDHVRISALASIPDQAKHRTVERRQFKTNVERLRRRRMLRKGETVEQVIEAIPLNVERKPDLPYVQLKSQSNAHGFSLFIVQGKLEDKPVQGTFNSYGLGKGATIPWF